MGSSGAGVGGNSNSSSCSAGVGSVAGGMNATMENAEFSYTPNSESSGGVINKAENNGEVNSNF